LANCDASEVAEIAGGAVAQSMDLWDLLLLKVSVEKGEETRTEAMLHQLDVLLDKAKENLASVFLNSPSPMEDSESATITVRMDFYCLFNLQSLLKQQRNTFFNL